MNLGARRICFIAFFSLFAVLSMIIINPLNSQSRREYQSNQLNKVTVEEGNTRRTDYTDNNGKITKAANLGYATVITTQTENEKLEEYFDESGRPAIRPEGYSAILRVYDNGNNTVRSIFLDPGGEPVITRDGYVIADNVYDTEGREVSARYYDADGNPVRTYLYGYGHDTQYDDSGHSRRSVFVDGSGDPTMTGQGFAIIVQNYIHSGGPNDGRVESEFYFDEQGKPVALSRGQYGTYREYYEDGSVALRTYLDAEGNPAMINRGYATARFNRDRNTSVYTEMYYDQDDNPVALSAGQYGIKTRNNQTIYLDRNGNEKFSLKMFVYTHTWMAVVFAIAAVILTVTGKKRTGTWMLAAYICIIIFFTLMFRERLNKPEGIRLFQSYGRILTDGKARADIIKNIWLFVPLGAILFRICPSKRILAVPLLLSVLIETVQLFSGIGYCEADDVLSNCAGALLGYTAAGLAADIMRKAGFRFRRKHTPDPVPDSSPGKS